MFIDSTQISCGIHQLHALYNHNNLDQSLFEAFEDSGLLQEDLFPGFSYILFSDTVANGNGTRLAKFIVRRKLGTVTSDKPVVNPNSSNKIKLWVWKVNRKALRDWALKMDKLVNPEEYEFEDGSRLELLWMPLDS
jgi:hypothetical protein